MVLVRCIVFLYTVIKMYPMHTSNCSHVYLTKCKLDGLPVTLHHCKAPTVNQNARYVGDRVLSKCAYTRTYCTQYTVQYKIHW